jgi:hypothetical protein
MGASGQGQASRRAILAGIAWGLTCAPGFRTFATEDLETDTRQKLRALGLDPVQEAQSKRFLIVGDAPQTLVRAASKLCEALADDYFDHFRKRGFTFHEPAARLVVIILSGPDSYAKFLGIPVEHAVGGQFDVATNRLVMFDQRAQAEPSPLAERANTFALVHEVTHQLTFNSGLLNPSSQVPKLISEGLATYAETRRPDAKARIGAVNQPRLADLGKGPDWIPLPDLLASDAAFDDPSRSQRAYAAAWLCIFTLMNDPKLRPGLIAYLDRLREGPAADRVKTATETLGDLSELEAAMRARATKLGVRGLARP